MQRLLCKVPVVNGSGSRERWATISSCGRYRYALGREWDQRLKSAVWIMLNPSTADAEVDDPTVRRCIGFAKGWGCGSIAVYNLFALRTSDPSVLRAEHQLGTDIVGRNDEFLGIADMALDRHDRNGFPSLLVAAWGAHPWAGPRVRFVMHSLFRGRPALCLGRTTNGMPRHPLFVRKLTALERY